MHVALMIFLVSFNLEQSHHVYLAFMTTDILDLSISSLLGIDNIFGKNTM